MVINYLDDLTFWKATYTSDWERRLQAAAFWPQLPLYTFCSLEHSGSFDKDGSVAMLNAETLLSSLPDTPTLPPPNTLPPRTPVIRTTTIHSTLFEGWANVWLQLDWPRWVFWSSPLSHINQHSIQLNDPWMFQSMLSPSQMWILKN